MVKFIETESRMVIARDGGRERRSCLVGIVSNLQDKSSRNFCFTTI